jgi:hypothetical protein
MTFTTGWTRRAYRLRASCLALVATLLVADAVHAQLQSGNLYGTVEDEQGEALPGVTVTLTGHGAPQVQVTNAKGRFRFLNLSPGSCSLKAELEGFFPAEFPNLSINVARNTEITVTMHVALEIVAAPPRPRADGAGWAARGALPR